MVKGAAVNKIHCLDSKVKIRFFVVLNRCALRIGIPSHFIVFMFSELYLDFLTCNKYTLLLDVKKGNLYKKYYF